MSERLWSETPRTLFVTTDKTDITTIYRVFWPALELAARGYIADYCTYSELYQYEAPLRYGRYTTVVTPRMAFETRTAENQWLALIGSLRDRVRWCYDSDDDLWSDVFIARQSEFFDNDPVVIQSLLDIRASRLRLLKLADMVTVASPYLAESTSQMLPTTPVSVVPNGINARAYAQAVQTGPSRIVPPLTVGWSGGPRLERDLEPLYDVWPRLAELRTGVHFVLQGWAPKSLVSLMPPDRLHVLPGVSAENYPSVLRNIDIFCCPTGDDEWQSNKTPIKWFEATLAGAACVVSPRLYGPAIDPPHAALVERRPSDWLRALVAMVDDPELRRTLHAAALHAVLAKHTLAQTYTAWLQAWALADMP